MAYTAGYGSLVLNFFQATFSTDTINIFVGPYQGADAYNTLIDAEDGITKWRDTDDGSRIFAWSHDTNQSIVLPGFKPVTVRLSESTPLFCRILLSSIEEHLYTLGFDAIGRDGFVNWNVGNYLKRAANGKIALDERLGIFPKISIETFVTRFKNNPAIIGIIVDVSHITRIEIPVDEMLATGFDPRGYYVKFRADIIDAAITNPDVTIGRVERVEAGHLILQDTRYRDVQKVDASLCWLEPKKYTLFEYIRHLYPTQARNLLEDLQDQINTFNSPPEKYRLIQEFVSRRLVGGENNSISLLPNVSVSFSDATICAEHAQAFQAHRLNAPVYSFDPESPKTQTGADNGLRQYGPYSREAMNERVSRILVLAPDVYKAQAEQFIRQFQRGIPGRERAYNGFQHKYHLKKVQFTEHYFPLRGAPKDAYYNATVEALSSSTEYDLCFVIIKDEFKQLAPSDNPYYVCKTLLMSFGVTVQHARIETLRATESSLQWTLNTMGLASYAKLGGTPFVLRARQLKYHELVIGIGSSVERAHGTKLSASKQVIGFTAIFRSDGDYLLSACTPYADFSNYQEKLEEVVRKSIAEVVRSEGIEDGATIRLIFHVYKRTGKKEGQAIQNAITKLTRYNIEFALLHINDSHNLKLFNNISLSEVRSGALDETDLIPPRQLMIELGPRERLITLIGPKQYRRRGMPRPVKLTLDRASTFKDLDYLAQQVYEFSCISWRSFNPSTQPVTVFYSQLMAGLNSKLKQIAAWNQELVRTRLSRKMWFI